MTISGSLAAADGALFLAGRRVTLNGTSITSVANTTVSVLATTGVLQVLAASSISALSGSVVFQSSDTTSASAVVAANITSSLRLTSAHGVGLSSVAMLLHGEFLTWRSFTLALAQRDHFLLCHALSVCSHV